MTDGPKPVAFRSGHHAQRPDTPELAALVERLNPRYFCVADMGAKFRVCHEVAHQRRGKPWTELVAQHERDFIAAYRAELVRVGESRGERG